MNSILLSILLHYYTLSQLQASKIILCKLCSMSSYQTAHPYSSVIPANFGEAQGYVWHQSQLAEYRALIGYHGDQIGCFLAKKLRSNSTNEWDYKEPIFLSEDVFRQMSWKWTQLNREIPTANSEASETKFNDDNIKTIYSLIIYEKDNEQLRFRVSAKRNQMPFMGITKFWRSKPGGEWTPTFRCFLFPIMLWEKFRNLYIKASGFFIFHARIGIVYNLCFFVLFRFSLLYFI